MDEVFYEGQCVDWTFTFTLPDGVASLEQYDQVRVHFSCGTLRRSVILSTFPTANTAFYHNEADFLSRSGRWTAQAWAISGVHVTPSREVVAFTVEAGVPAE